MQTHSPILRLLEASGPGDGPDSGDGLCAIPGLNLMTLPRGPGAWLVGCPGQYWSLSRDSQQEVRCPTWGGGRHSAVPPLPGPPPRNHLWLLGCERISFSPVHTLTLSKGLPWARLDPLGSRQRQQPHVHADVRDPASAPAGQGLRL